MTNEEGKAGRAVLARRIEGCATCGDPLDSFAAMGYAPMNEAGVMVLFGMLAERMGFYVEEVRPTFPDCVARQLLGPNEWQRVRIEFEYESRNFQKHGHDPKGCDLIVCWRHDWEECPLGVIALSDAVAQRKMTNDPFDRLRAGFAQGHSRMQMRRVVCGKPLETAGPSCGGRAHRSEDRC